MDSNLPDSNKAQDRPASTSEPSAQSVSDNQDRTIESGSSPTESVTTTTKRKLPKKLLLILAVLLLVLGGGAYAYVGIYKQQPAVLYNDAMQNTADGLEEFSAIDSLTASGQSYKGTIAIEKPLPVTGNFDGKAKDNNSETSGSLSAAGAKIDFDIRSIGSEISEYPDVYFKLRGLNSVAGFVGEQNAATLNELNDRWLFADHTLFSQAVSSVTQSPAENVTNLSITEEDIKTIRTKYSDVLRQYVFTTDESQAVMQRSGEPKKEDFDGHKAIKYPVTVNKGNLKAFVAAMKDATKDTKLQQIIAPGEKSLDDALNFDQLLQEIDKADTSKVNIEVWADASKRYIRNVRITPEPKDGQTGFIDIGLDYKDGNEFPFYIKIDSKKDQQLSKAGLTMSLNNTSKMSKFTVDVDVSNPTQTSNDVKGKFSVDITPNGDDVSPEKPTDAKNIMDLMKGLQSAGAANDATALEASNFPQLNDDIEL